MINVFSKMNSEEFKGLNVQLSNGRVISLEDLILDYERFSEQVSLKVGEWFHIDREIINKNRNKIQSECNKFGKNIWKRFEWANQEANQHPDQYPNIIKTYIFERGDYTTEEDVRDMCKRVGDGMCDEVICLLELQMRICNGETMEDLCNKIDKLPYRRIIESRRSGGMLCYFGGGNVEYELYPSLHFIYGRTDNKGGVPYAFRRVFK